MIKKSIVTAAVVVIGAVAFLGKDVCSYGRTVFGNVREAVHAEIEPQFKLDIVRDQVDCLMPEIRQQMKVVAEQFVDARNMQASIEEKQNRLTTQKASILVLRADLDNDKDEFHYRQVSYTRHEVESDLRDRFDAYQLQEASLDRDIKILTATKQALKANQKNLDGMMSRKEDLKVKVAQAEARLRQLQATETVNAVEVDDTRLSHVEKMLEQLNYDMDVRETLLETEGNVQGRIPLEESDILMTDVADEIDQHFGLTGTHSVAELTVVNGL